MPYTYTQRATLWHINIMDEYHIKALNANNTGSKNLHDFIFPLNINFIYKTHVYIVEKIEIKEAQVQ